MNARNRQNGPDGGRMVEALVDLVNTTYPDELTAEEQLGLVRLEQTWQREGTPRLRRTFSGFRVLATALAVAAIFPASYLVYTRYAHLTYQVANGNVGANGLIQETRPGTVVLFSEGSQVELETGTRARVASTTAEGGRMVLEDGDVRAEIVHRPRARWTVEAGPYTIRVTGTAFDVRWSASDNRLDCQMKRGSVVITGPLVPAGVTLSGRMRLTASPRTRQLAIDDVETVAAGQPSPARTTPEPRRAPSAEPVSEPAAIDDRSMAKDAGPRHQGAGPTASVYRREALRRNRPSPPPDDSRHDVVEQPWNRRVALGDFQSVLTNAEAQGIDHVLDSAPGADLAALADAARYTHHTATSRRALLALRARFPNDRESRDTAFFLGGLSEDETGSSAAASINWYDQYLRENPTGRFVNQALGRTMVLTHESRGSAAARPVAEEYLRRFSNGPYAGAARKLLQIP
jgi:hypothetical protein